MPFYDDRDSCDVERLHTATRLLCSLGKILPYETMKQIPGLCEWLQEHYKDDQQRSSI